jgi:hypothetical protein
VLVGFLETLHETLLLLLAREMQEELEDDHALPGEVVLEVGDVGEALVPNPFADELRRQLLALQNPLCTRTTRTSS